MRWVLALPLLLCLATAEPAYRYGLDPAHSDVSARVAFFGIDSRTARFPQMVGEFTLRPTRLETIDLAVELDARALTADDRMALAELKGPKFFDAERYPAVRFASTQMTMTGPKSARIDGTITVRDISRPATLNVTFAQAPALVDGQTPVTIAATTAIDRRQFGMTASDLIVGNKVTITINATMTPR